MGNVRIHIDSGQDSTIRDYALYDLRLAIRDTRQEGFGVPLATIASIINDELTKDEVDALVKQLTVISSSL